MSERTGYTPARRVQMELVANDEAQASIAWMKQAIRDLLSELDTQKQIKAPACQ